MSPGTLLISASVESGFLSYRVSVRAKATEDVIRDLITHTDQVAEVQNTLRLGIPVDLESFKAESVASAPP